MAKKKALLTELFNSVNPFDRQFDPCINDSCNSDVAEKALFANADKGETLGDGISNQESNIKGVDQNQTEVKLLCQWEPDNSPAPDMDTESKGSASEKKKTVKGPSLRKIAECVIKKHHVICFWGELRFYNGMYYELLDDKVARSMIADEMSDEQKDDIWFFQNLDRVLEAIKKDHSIDLHLTGREPSKEIVTLKNCNLNLKTGEVSKHSHKVITTYAIDAKYLEDDDLWSPRWDGYITDAIDGDADEVLDYVETLLGYMLCPSNEAKAFLVFGTASNSGKSVFENLIHKLLGDNNLSNVALNDLGDKFKTSRIVGKPLNISMDLPNQKITDEAAYIVKMITGGDFMEMERKYQIPFNYKGVGKLIFATNHLIRTVSDDKAFYERMWLIPFMNSVPESRRDPKLLNRLLGEKDSIVTKALQAAMELYDNGFQLPKLKSAERIKWAWEKSVPETVDCFLRDCCEESDDGQDFESTMKLIKVYREYCKENDYIAGNMKAFSSQLKEYFEYCVRDLPSVDGRRHQARGFIGIRLLQ